MISRGRVHQSRLYYLRDLSGKAARIKEREYTHTAAAVETEPAEASTSEGGEAAEAAPAAAPRVKKPRKTKK